MKTTSEKHRYLYAYLVVLFVCATSTLVYPGSGRCEFSRSRSLNHPLIKTNHRYLYIQNSKKTTTTKLLNLETDKEQASHFGNAATPVLQYFSISNHQFRRTTKHSKQHTVSQWLGCGVFRREEASKIVLIFLEPCKRWNQPLINRRRA